MSFIFPKEIRREQICSPVLKFSIHDSHCSKSQTDKKDRKICEIPATMYLICQGAGTADLCCKFASQSEHPFTGRQVGALA